VCVWRGGGCIKHGEELSWRSTKPSSEDPKANSASVSTSVAEPHHFYAAPALDPAPDKNFDAAPAPTLLYRYSKAKFLK
jgi:hypothetical protein